MDGLLDALHDVRTARSGVLGGRENVSDSHAFELLYRPRETARETESTTRAVTMQYVPAAEAVGAVERQLHQHYPDSQIERRPADLIPALTGETDQHVSVATLETARYDLFPIKSIDLPGFDVDPIGSVIQEMVGTERAGRAGADVAVQILFRPARREWHQGVDGGPSVSQLAHNLKQPSYDRNTLPLGVIPGLGRVPGIGYETIEMEPSKADRRVAKLLSEQSGHGWEFVVRVVAASTDAAVARQRCARVAGMFSKYYELHSEQTLRAAPVAVDDLLPTLEATVAREWPGDGWMTKAQRELAGLVNVPEAEHVSSNKVQWALSKAGKGVPPGTPRFDFDRWDVEPRTPGAQAAMLRAARENPLEPLWLGYGSRHGTEAGIEVDTLNTHVFVGGQTGQGKTTWLTGEWRQIIDRPLAGEQAETFDGIARGHGAMIFDPKGMDTDEFVSLIPEHRRDDLVFVEIGGDRDRQVAFNFLEVPSDADPGSHRYGEAVESLVEDTIASIAQGGGGDEDYWGPRMSRISKNMIRGMAQSGYDCTLLDMYFALTDERGRERYAGILDNDRTEWLRQYAETHLADMDAKDIEPLAGRLQEWVENPLLRELVSHPESTVSIEDVVREGKLVVVRDATSQEGVGRMVATALLRRLWVAIQEQTLDANHPDPPDFYALLDEFDNIASTASNITTILSNARSFGLSITAACQDPSAQLDEATLNAIEGQCQTFISFNPGRYDDARLLEKQHSPDIDDEDLLNLSQYRFYMRTHDDRDELTHSFKVKGHPPAADLKGVACSAEEVEARIDASLERFGAPRRTSEDIKRESVFYQGSSDTEDSLDGHDPAGRAGDMVVKAAFDAALHAHGDGEAAVDATVARERAADYLDDDLARATYADLVERASGIDFDTTDGTERVHVTESGPARFLSSGDAASAGSLAHRDLLRDAYGWLTRLGLRVDVPTQHGDRAVDAVGYLEETIDIASAPSLRRAWETLRDEDPALAFLTDGGDVAVEAESSTASKPAQTIRNLAKAYEAGERCLFVVRETDADTVYATLADPPFVSRERADGSEVLYNDGPLTLADGRLPLRPAGPRQTEWRRLRSGRLVCRDSDGETLARFDSAERIWAGDDTPWPRVITPDVEVPDGWTRIAAPLVPELVFENGAGEGLPTPEDWSVVVVPATTPETAPADALAIVDAAGHRSLTEAIAGETAEADNSADAIDTSDFRDDLADLRSRE